jgi:EAL domain-containing protein (putative c-di-GMP-specific phosphodiesterase class I)/CheY-like chemotaxis protein
VILGFARKTDRPLSIREIRSCSSQDIEEVTMVRLAAVRRDADERPSLVALASVGDMVDAPPRILIADDDPFMRESLVEILEAAPLQANVVAAADAAQAVRLARSVGPDVAILDTRMPRGGGTRAAAGIRRVAPECRILALSIHHDRQDVLRMIEAGATGYLTKGGPTPAIVDAVNRMLRGESVLSNDLAGHVVDGYSEIRARERRSERRRAAQVARIQRVIEGGSLSMVLQPIVELESRTPVGMEALARFLVEPHRRPDVWFAEARALGIGDELELEAVRLALECLPFIPDGAYLSVNISADALSSPALGELLESAEPDRVVLEITEHEAVADYTDILTSIASLRRLGLRIAVDDVGAGFASLRHLLRVSPDLLKLDVSLCRHVNTAPGRALVHGLLSFAEHSGATVVAEGIETEEELDGVRSLGVGLGQGYLLGRPAPICRSRPIHGGDSH